jgi:hypothetical protein
MRGGASAGAGTMTGSMDLPAKGGFDFDLCRRNNMLEKNGLKVPGFLKTGTTIVGLVFQVRPPYSRCVAFWYIPAIGVVTFCWFRATCLREFERHEPSCAVVCSC